MKILLLHNTLPEYRIEWFLELQKLANVDFVFTNQEINYKNYHTSIQKDRVPNSIFLANGYKGFSELSNILIRIEEYDAVELPPVDSLHEFIMSLMVVKAAKKHRVKIAYFWEKWEAPKDKQPLKRKIKNLILGTAAKVIYKNANVIFAGGTNSKKYFINNGVNEAKITILPNCSYVPDCRFESIRKKYNIPANKKLLLYFGRLMPEKGLTYLLRAMTKLDDSYFLLVAGGGDKLDEFKELAHDLNIHNVYFAGQVDPRFRKNFFEQCDIFVFPGTWLGGWVDVWGLTNNEAIQFNKPIVSTYAVGSAVDLIISGVNGYVVEPENVDRLYEAIIKVSSLDLDVLCNTDAKLSVKYSAKEMARTFVNRLKE